MNYEKRFNFTPENLLDNLSELGGWSAYGLAVEALMHYFPDEYNENGACEVEREIELTTKLGCMYWQDVIVKYHKEVGYTKESFSNEECVNQY